MIIPVTSCETHIMVDYSYRGKNVMQLLVPVLIVRLKTFCLHTCSYLNIYSLRKKKDRVKAASLKLV